MAKKEETVEETKADATEEVVEEKSEAKAEEKEAEVVAEDATEAVETGAETESSDDGKAKTKNRKRAEKVGIVYSDKMTKTVVVRVNRMVKHQLYHKYMKKRKKFMAHDELGASVGDRVKIVETRPLSAKKRWRVVEIIQKAAK